MYRIMIADDESIAVDALNYIINRHFEGQCETESARTGRQVIELVDSFRPDIVLMDIQMPGINGIEAMREIRRSHPSILFIVVSAYVKFDYAKDAIEIGVQDYLNKPVDREKLVRALEQAMKRVDEVRARRSSDLENREKMEIVTPMIESSFLYALIHQSRGREELDCFRTLLSMQEEAGYVMSLEAEDFSEKERGKDGMNAGLRIQKDYGVIKDILKQHFQCYVSGLMGNRILMLVPAASLEEEYPMRIQIIEKAGAMLRELSRICHTEFRIGIGAVHGMDSLQESYHESMRALLHNRLDAVVHISDLPSFVIHAGDYPLETERALFKQIAAGNQSRVVREIRCFYEWMMEHYSANGTDVRLKVLELVLRAELTGYENGGMLYRFTRRSEYMETVMGIKDYQQLYEWLEGRVIEVCRSVTENREENTADLVKQAQAYIEKNYAKEIMLDELSKDLGISSYYFSKLFKKKTGINFIEYVTNIRMEKAKELLLHSDKSMKEICREVGYTDANYFSRTFRKNVGVSPTEFKEGM